MMSIKKLPLVLENIKVYLKHTKFSLSTEVDGRLNSAISEKIILNLLSNYLKPDSFKIPPIRSWYDILLYDDEYQWIPVNIKITKTTSADNIGNLACCVQSFTNFILDPDQNYDNGFLSKVLIESFVKNNYNENPKKDYFCLVINKTSVADNLTNDIIINSILSISKFTPNINNLPFQIQWSKNKEPIDIPIPEQIQKFKNLYKTTELPWSLDFINNMKKFHNETNEPK